MADSLEKFAERSVKRLGLDESMDKASLYFKDLLYIGGWDLKQQNRKSEIVLYECLINKSRKSRPQTRYLGGSFVEGSEMKGSDHDNMFVYSNVKVTTIASNYMTTPSDKVVCLMCEGSRACYAQLRFLQGPQIDLSDEQFNLMRCLVEKDGNLYLSSRRYAESQFTLIKSRISLPTDNIQFAKNGPCASLESGELMVDYVFTLECDEWPPVAAEWGKRARHYEWPDTNLIDAVINTKCSLVPISNPASENSVREFEWRISFLLGERQLMWSLNQSQYFCFILLKKLKKHFIDPNNKDVISSFILKTTLFWELEKTKTATWNNNTIIEKVTSCLNRLRRYVEKKSLPHYFAKENNLFTGKFVADEDHKKLIQTIDDISKNLLVYLYMDATMIIPCDDCKVSHVDCKWRQDKIFSRNYLYCNIETALHHCNLHDLECFEHDLTEQREPYILDVHKQKAKELLCLKFAMALYTKYVKEQDKENVKTKLTEIEERYKQAKEVDAICGRLHLATFYFKQQRFNQVDTEIKSIYEKADLLYDGGCSNIRLLQFTKNSQTDGEKKSNIAHDISFCISDMCAPNVVLAILRAGDQSVIRIHPLVYMYLLEFLISSESIDDRRQALWNLSCEVENSLGGHDTDIALNICGYCYLVVGERLNALHCFSRSFRVRPSVKNACIFYGSIMLFFELGGRIVNAVASILF